MHSLSIVEILFTFRSFRNSKEKSLLCRKIFLIELEIVALKLFIFEFSIIFLWFEVIAELMEGFTVWKSTKKCIMREDHSLLKYRMYVVYHYTHLHNIIAKWPALLGICSLLFERFWPVVLHAVHFTENSVKWQLLTVTA